MVPSFMALLHRIEEQRNMKIITNKERKEISDTIKKRVSAITKELFEYYQDDLYTPGLEDYIIKAATLVVNYLNRIPKQVSVSLVKLGRFYYLEDRDRYERCILPLIMEIRHASRDKNKIFDEINSIQSKIIKKRIKFRTILRRKRGD